MSVCNLAFMLWPRPRSPRGTSEEASPKRGSLFPVPLPPPCPALTGRPPAVRYHSRLVTQTTGQKASYTPFPALSESVTTPFPLYHAALSSLPCLLSLRLLSPSHALLIPNAPKHSSAGGRQVPSALRTVCRLPPVLADVRRLATAHRRKSTMRPLALAQSFSKVPSSQGV